MEELKRENTVLIILDAERMTSREEAHEYLKTHMNLPDYYGKNLDALHDCLTELPETHVRFIHVKKTAGTYFDRVRRVFEDSAKENPALTAEWKDSETEHEPIMPDEGYQVICLDMDGTVLNDQKEIDPLTAEAIHRALKAGREAVFCTGRSYAEMEEILKEFPDMHYLLGESGAMIYDLREKKVLYKAVIPQQIVDELEKILSGRDVCVNMFFDGQTWYNENQVDHLEKYEMSPYKDFLPRIASTISGNLITYMRQCGKQPEKLNMYHTSSAERQKTIDEVKRRGLMQKAEFIISEISSLECSPKGVTKGSGILHLCSVLGIRPEQVIMVGDAPNDLPGLKAAGLAVAMGNAADLVKAASHVTVADNNHGGCAEAIDRFLLR